MRIEGFYFRREYIFALREKITGIYSLTIHFVDKKQSRVKENVEKLKTPFSLTFSTDIFNTH